MRSDGLCEARAAAEFPIPVQRAIDGGDAAMDFALRKWCPPVAIQPQEVLWMHSLQSVQ